MENLTEAERLLKELTEALDSAFISSWQSTHTWQFQLDEAKEYFYRKELRQGIENNLSINSTNTDSPLKSSRAVL